MDDSTFQNFIHLAPPIYGLAQIIASTGLFADFLCHSVATTSTCPTNLEAFDEIKTRSKGNSQNKLLGNVFKFLEDITIY